MSTAAYRRRTSAYSLRIAAKPGDLRAQLDAVVAALPAEVGLSDQHYAAEEGDSGYLSVTWRSGSPEAAVETAEKVRAGLPAADAVLHTGLGVHRRVVKEWTVSYADRITKEAPACVCAAAYLNSAIHEAGCPASPDAGPESTSV